MALRLVLLISFAMAMAVFIVGSVRIAEASHKDYMVLNPDRNPNGTSNPKLWGVQRAWVISGQPLSVCSDWGSSFTSIPLGIRQAVSDWEAVLPGSQFSQDCSAYSEKLWFKLRSVSPSGWPLICDGYWACVLESFSPDSYRGADYFTNPTIWIDDTNFSYFGQRVEAHRCARAGSPLRPRRVLH